MNVELQCDKFVTEMCKNRRFTARMGGMRNAQAAEILNRWRASGKDWQTRAALLHHCHSPKINPAGAEGK